MATDEEIIPSDFQHKCDLVEAVLRDILKTSLPIDPTTVI